MNVRTLKDLQLTDDQKKALSKLHQEQVEAIMDLIKIRIILEKDDQAIQSLVRLGKMIHKLTKKKENVLDKVISSLQEMPATVSTLYG